MCFHEGFYITKPQPEAFNIVQVAGVSAVELFEDTVLGLFVHTYAIVLYLKGEHATGVQCFHLYMQLVFRVFYCIIQQVENDVGKVHLIGLYNMFRGVLASG